jgi:hypothetical protein
MGVSFENTESEVAVVIARAGLTATIVMLTKEASTSPTFGSMLKARPRLLVYLFRN